MLRVTRRRGFWPPLIWRGTRESSGNLRGGGRGRHTGGQKGAVMGVLADLADELKYDRERQLQFGAFRASTPPPSQ